MKKILTAALVVIVAALALTGCNDQSNNSTSTDQSSSTNTSSDNNSSTDSNPSEDSSSSGDSTSSDESSGDPDEGLQYPDNKAGRMAKAALDFNPDEWSMAMNIADGEMMSISMPDLTPDMFEEYCLVVDLIGINGHTVFVGKAKAGQEETVKTAIEKSLNSYKEQVAFYPAGQESAAGAASGVTDDGYNYFVIHADGANIAAAMAAVN